MKLRLAALLVCVACHTPRQASLGPLPRAAYAHYLAARMASATGDWSAAADELAAAAAAAPAQPMIAVELARAQLKAGRTAEAQATLAAVRVAWPEHAEVWLASGDVLAASDAPAAMAAYERAADLAPTDERAYLGLMKLEPEAEQEKTLHALVEHVPTSVEGHYRLALRLALRDELPAAIAELHAVLELDPDHLDARLDLARALRRQGKLAEAVAETRSAFDRSGQSLDVAEELFAVLCEADDVGAALDLLTLLDDDRSDAEGLGLVARLYRGLGRLEAARAVTARIVARDGDAGAIAEAELDLAEGDPVAAAARALTVPDASPRFARARRVAADAFLAAGDPAHALTALEPARAAAPADLGLALTAAYALVDLAALPSGSAAGPGRGHAATSPEVQAVFAQIAPARATELTIARARVADRAGDPTAALALLEPLLATHPDLPDAANLAGYLLADANTRLPDATRYLTRARTLAPGDAATLDSWGWLQLRLGHAREAVRVLGHAARLAPREPEVLLHLAAAWAADGAPQTAARVLDDAAALRPPVTVQQRLDALRSSIDRGAAVLR